VAALEGPRPNKAANESPAEDKANVSHLEDATGDDLSEMIDRRAAGAELAVDKLRAEFGKDAVVKGIMFEED
jgi:hypothetical protein